MHWATWALQQGFMNPADLAPGGSRDAHGGQPLITAVHDFMATLPHSSEPHGRSRSRVSVLAGCDVDVHHLSSRILDLLPQVCQPTYFHLV